MANHSVFLKPRFGVGGMVRKPKRKVGPDGKPTRRQLGKRTVKAMLAWGHYASHKLLFDRCKHEGSTCEAIEVSEHSTSFPCSSC